MYAAIKGIFVNISSIRPRLPHVVRKGGGTRIIELYNNYSMDKIPPDEDVLKLSVFIGKGEEQAMWPSAGCGVVLVRAK
jgi:hypothetical protein